MLCVEPVLFCMQSLFAISLTLFQRAHTNALIQRFDFFLVCFHLETQQATNGISTGNPKYFVNCCLKEREEKTRGTGEVRKEVPEERREVVNNGERLPEHGTSFNVRWYNCRIHAPERN